MLEIVAIHEENADEFRELIGERLTPGQGGLAVLSEGRGIAAALFTATGSVCTMDYIFVVKGLRRMGIGSLLVEKAREAFLESGIETMMVYYANNEECTLFLESLGFVVRPGLPLYSMPIEELAESKRAHNLINRYGSENVIPFDDMDRNQKGQILERVRQSFPDDSFFDPGEYDGKYSLAYVNKEGPQGILLAKERAGDVYGTLLFSMEEDRTTVLRLASAFSMILFEGDRTGKLYFVSLRERVRDFLEATFGEDEIMESEGICREAVLFMRSINEAAEV